jgi:hypothetical protein
MSEPGLFWDDWAGVQSGKITPHFSCDLFCVVEIWKIFPEYFFLAGFQQQSELRERCINRLSGHIVSEVKKLYKK